MVEVNYYDTSEYMYRNSSSEKGGFKGTIGLVDVDDDTDTSGTEDINQVQTQLTEGDQEHLREMILALTECTTEQLCVDKTDLKARANQAWTRALNLYPVYKDALDAELDDLKAETYAWICMMESQWARTAGSSLNCLVQSMKNKAEVELARRMAGMVAESLRRMKEHETEALRIAFENDLTARMEPNKTGLSQIGSLFAILRGATTTDVTDRDYTESSERDTMTKTAMGDFYYENTVVSDNEGTYKSDTASAASAAMAIAVGILNPF